MAEGQSLEESVPACNFGKQVGADYIVVYGRNDQNYYNYYI